jgi:hypothetical protein
MKKKFFNYIFIFLFIFSITACNSDYDKIYSSNPLEYPEQHQFIYKANKVEKLYWEFVNSKGNNVQVYKSEAYLTTPEVWREELFNEAKTLYHKRHGE